MLSIRNCQDTAPSTVLCALQELVKVWRTQESGVVNKGCTAATLKILQNRRNSTKQNTHGKITPMFQNIYSLTFTGHPKCGGQWSMPCCRHGEKAEGIWGGAPASTRRDTGLPLSLLSRFVLAQGTWLWEWFPLKPSSTETTKTS